MQPHNDRIDQEFFEKDRERSARAEETLWLTVGRLYHWRRFIIGVTGAVAVAAVVITLLMPNQYKADARLLLPEAGGGLSAAVMKNLPSAASALLGGGGGGDYIRYLAILTSRSVREAAVDSFQLIHVYGLEEDRHPREAAVDLLAKNVKFELDLEYDFLSVGVLDQSPQRAAEMANFLVRKLNDMNARLSSQNAGAYRRFLEKRYRRSRAEIDSLLNVTEQFQKQYGVFDLPAQTQGFFEQVASLRAHTVEAEIQYEVALEQYGPENPQVRMYRELVRSANRKYQNALDGQEQLLPVPQSEVPELAHRYAALELEGKIQRSILEIVAPMYEQARLQEEQQVAAVQVVDDAVPPTHKASPKRSIIVIAATVSAFLLALVFVLLFEWWRANHAYIARRFHASVVSSDRDREEHQSVSS